ADEAAPKGGGGVRDAGQVRWRAVQELTGPSGHPLMNGRRTGLVVVSLGQLAPDDLVVDRLSRIRTSRDPGDGSPTGGLVHLGVALHELLKGLPLLAAVHPESPSGSGCFAGLEGEAALLTAVGAFEEREQLSRPAGVGVEGPQAHRNLTFVVRAKGSAG